MFSSPCYDGVDSQQNTLVKVGVVSAGFRDSAPRAVIQFRLFLYSFLHYPPQGSLNILSVFIFPSGDHWLVPSQVASQRLPNISKYLPRSFIQYYKDIERNRARSLMQLDSSVEIAQQHFSSQK